MQVMLVPIQRRLVNGARDSESPIWGEIEAWF